MYVFIKNNRSDSRYFFGVRSKKKGSSSELLHLGVRRHVAKKSRPQPVLDFPIWEVRGRCVSAGLLLCFECTELVVERLAHHAVAHRTISSNAILQFVDHSFLLSHIVEF